jgi:DNA-binding CsgD family transcriptional regulator
MMIGGYPVLRLNALENTCSEPYVLIFDFNKQVTFANQTASEAFKVYHRPGHVTRHTGHFKIPDAISLIHAELRSRSKALGFNSHPDDLCIKRIVQIRDSQFMVHAFAILDTKSRPPIRFLVLLNKLFVRSKFELENARVCYQLSLKEFAVVQLLVGGLTNKEIGNKLCIAESTVKEYLRNIMLKVGASTRCGVVAHVLSPPDRRHGNAGWNREAPPAPGLRSRKSIVGDMGPKTYREVI